MKNLSNHRFVNRYWKYSKTINAVACANTFVILARVPLQNPFIPLVYIIVYTQCFESVYFFYVPDAALILYLTRSIGCEISPANSEAANPIRNSM